MSKEGSSIGHKAERKSFELIISTLLKTLDKNDRSKQFGKFVDYAKMFYGKGYTDEDYQKIKSVLCDPDNKWVKYINRVLDETDRNIAKTALLNLGYEAFFRGTKKIRENREIYNCNIPWLILFDPTSACNMHCQGCWSGTYGRKYNLSFDDMDKIVTEGKELGVYFYMMTGGEPLVRKDDIIKLAKKHSDAYFALFTNSTLIDEDLCQKVLELGNIAFILSIEGTEESNDERRGSGHYDKVIKAMDLLHSHGIIFGTSICYTRHNIDAVTSDDFINMLVEKGARFSFYFHYMPVGNNAVPELMPTKEQREYMIKRIRYIRSLDSPFEFFAMDFQNDGEYVGGCIAGGRNYFHINSAGDAEPCVFIHYSNMNIHEHTILEILQSPLFMAYRQGQPFNKNHLRPCPMLENPEILRKLVSETNAYSTDLESPESVDHLCSKCDEYAKIWQPSAEEIWAEKSHIHTGRYQNYVDKNKSE